MDSSKFKYKNKITAISSYFGVSEQAAKYMYHRRQRGLPYKTETDDLYIEWNVKIQNALVKADKISGFNWDDLEFSDDINVLNNNNIIVNNQSPTVYINKNKELNYNEKNNELNNEKNNQIECDENNQSDNTDETDGWTTVITDKGQMIRRKILKKIGFLPNTKFKNNINNKEKNNNKEKITEKNNIKTDIPKVLVI